MPVQEHKKAALQHCGAASVMIIGFSKK